MNLQHKPINFEDARGAIRDVLIGSDVDAVTLITCAKDSVRGNHYHKLSMQYSYILKGSFMCATQTDENALVETYEAKEGDLITHPPGERHAFKALEDSIFLSLTKGPRQGKNYEEDTYRLENPILT
jgi:quercetin dioxygenase-like cupin family protein